MYYAFLYVHLLILLGGRSDSVCNGMHMKQASLEFTYLQEPMLISAICEALIEFILIFFSVCNGCFNGFLTE